MDLALGVRRVIDLGQIRPYGGAGIVYGTASGKFEIPGLGFSASSNGSAAGIWGGAGAQALFGHAAVGFDLRYSAVMVRWSGNDQSEGGFMGALTVGYGF